MSTVFQAIEHSPSLELSLVVTGAHLSDAYGKTVQEIKSDGFQIIDEVESLINGDELSSRIKGLGLQLQGLVQTVARIKPDILLVLGDREEAISTALIGAYMNIPTAHVAGGDRVVGNVDDQIRHAVTKLSHLHFTTNQESYDRIIKLGEQPFRVFNSGHPGLDRLLKTPELSISELSKLLGFEINEDEPFVLLIQHVLSSEVEDSYFQMKQSLEAIKKLGIKTVLSYPNSDAGGQQMIKAILEYQDLNSLYFAKNIPRLEFVNIMRKASCMLGNSSAGILEAPLLKLPVINVGNRQKGRLHAQNVKFVPHSIEEICRALKSAVHDQTYRNFVKTCSSPYGYGNSSEQIVQVLENVQINKKLLVKDITF